MYHITPGSIVLFFVPPLPLELLLLDSGRCAFLLCSMYSLQVLHARLHAGDFALGDWLSCALQVAKPGLLQEQ
eukprot:scaffold82732_cov14-Tisochrysis_lutea.AAC.1